jgi:replicative DNA helicase
MRSGDATRKRPGPTRIPPNDVDAERALLGACLLKSEAIAAALEIVTPEDFYRPAHGHVFDTIAALHAQAAEVDPITVADQLTRAGLLKGVGDLPALVEMQGDTSATSSVTAPAAASTSSWSASSSRPTPPRPSSNTSPWSAGT